MSKKMQGLTAAHKGTGTVIGEGVVLEKATLNGSGVVRIDGEFTGTIDINGHIVLGETGILNGDVRAETALFAGKYQGNLHIKSTLHIASTADLTGQVESAKLIIDEGATLSGTCNVPKLDTSKNSKVDTVAKAVKTGNQKVG